MLSILAYIYITDQQGTVSNVITVDRSNLVSFTRDILSRENKDYPSYGIISNTARLDFIDTQKTANLKKNYPYEGLRLIENGKLHSGLRVGVYLQKEGTNIQNTLLEMNILSLNYDNDKHTISLELKDNLETWQNINVEQIEYDPLNSTEQNAKWLFNILYEKTINAGFTKFPTFDELDIKTKAILEYTTIKYPFIYSGSLWEQWNKLCELCLLHIYVKDDGKIVVEYNFGD